MLKYKRLLPIQKRSFLLFGPRGTGKSSWVNEVVDAEITVNLLNSNDFFKFNANPAALYHLCEDLKQGQWVVIDEAQKAPQILNEVHRLIEDKRINFAITGSSARKLKQVDVNLLGGRANRLDFFPLCFQEISDDSFFKHTLNYGSLPLCILEQENAPDILSAYVATYLKEEIAAEALTKNLMPYARFLETAARNHAQQLNISNIATQSSLKRNIVDSYFQILEDTLIGYRLPALELGLREKEAVHPKFYFFDPGVARAAAGWIYEDMPDSWLGFSFETIVINEIRAYNSYLKKQKNIFHYAVHGSFDVDIFIETKKKILHSSAAYLGIQVKLSPVWNQKWTQNLDKLRFEAPKKIQRTIGIYTGNKILEYGKTVIFPWMKFVELLWSGEFF
jgi:predicted AAA+ superfamily ATPase